MLSYDWFDKTCNVRSETTGRVNGSMQITKVSVFSDEACDFWEQSKENWKESDLARQTDLGRYEVAINIDKEGLVKKGMIIELIDMAGDSRGEFIVDSLDIFKLPGLCDCADYILLKVSNR